MWRVNFNQYRDLGAMGSMYQRYSAAQANPASRIAMIAAAVVVGLPLLVLLLAAVLVGLVVFVTMVAIGRVVMLVRAGLDVLGGSMPASHDDQGRDNVRVIRRD